MNVRRRRLPPLLAATALVVVVVTAGCGSDDTSTTDATSGGSAAATGQTLTVFTAASLQSPFDAIAEQLEQRHDGLDVRLSYAGSSDLAAQLVEGAPADVLATADERTMSTVTDADLIDGEPQIFAGNTMTIVVPKGNPADVSSVADLAGQDVVLALCAPQVPCGAAAERVERAAGVTLTPATEESKVTDVLGKISSGEADAGIVYVTDATGAREDVESVAIDDADNTSNAYPVAVLAGAAEPELAAEFRDLVLEDGGRRDGALANAGFAPPPAP